ncbi:transcription antiterminator [Vagococcus fluvialis]|uniref:BglG family transcription antiterminator n=1 Tax=Vagococcus fluvialis TaxID=2738 RepID=UPI001A8D4F17|nr:BglG family transcription antiterminator [Vagococcus fluvialis]MBO0428072.1 transcription antiterminator [Vagococcus fluvialis]
MLKKRQKRLLELLESQSDYLTVSAIANQLGVSKRTVHSDLKRIEEYVQSLGKYLDKKRGVGIVLRELKENKYPKDVEEDYDTQTTVTRRIEIMRLLLFEESNVSFNYLSDLFFVSKTSIIKDLEFIMEIFKAGSKVELQSDVNGTRICGNEIDKQKAFLQFNRYILSNSDLYHEETIHQKMNLLIPFYGEKIISVCTNSLYSYVRENVNAISDYYIQNILNIYIILIYRITNNYHICLEKEIKFSSKSTFFDKSAINLLMKAQFRLNISYSENDVAYLSHHLIANRFEPFPEDSIDNNLVDDLLNQVSKALNIDFSNDIKLEDQLKKHIPPMIYRLQNNNKTENPFTEQIKVEFSLTFNVIWVILSEYENELNIRFNEDEIAFLTIYFQSAIERAKINRKFLIICQMGIATSELLMNRIKNIIPSLDSIEVASVPELDHMNLDQFDFIISTIKIDIPEKQVIFVSPFLTDIDIEKIKKLGFNQEKQKTQLDYLIDASHLKRYVNKEFIYIDTDYSTKEELLNSVGKELVSNNYVTENFVSSLISREELGGTDLPTGVAVPHGNPSDVKRTTIAILKNKKKFKWDTYYVDVIFVIGISSENRGDTRKILSDIYNIIDTPKSLEEIKQAKYKEDLFIKLGSELNG